MLSLSALAALRSLRVWKRVLRSSMPHPEPYGSAVEIGSISELQGAAAAVDASDPSNVPSRSRSRDPPKILHIKTDLEPCAGYAQNRARYATDDLVKTASPGGPTAA